MPETVAVCVWGNPVRLEFRSDLASGHALSAPKAHNMFHLVYVSSAVQPLKNDELVELLTKAWEKNRRLDVSGMLLYRDGGFVQVLEGEESSVRGLFASICADPSHRGIIVLLEDPLAKPLFAGWSMGFRNLADPELLALPGFSRFMNSALNVETFKDDPSGCMGLLNLFRENR